jgi:hypothetical protein
VKKVVTRERNKGYYRVLHVPIWLWVFFILPGHLTYALFTTGPNRWHALWLAVVLLVCAWRGFAGRLPGVEERPYITHYGVDAPNLPYRVVCYTAAWICLLVPFSLNLIGIAVAAFTGEWMLGRLFAWLYYPLALLVVLATALNLTPRAKRSTRYEGAEKAWFYVAVWTVVPTQIIAWAAWRLLGAYGVTGLELARMRLGIFLAVTAMFLIPGVLRKLPRTDRYELPEGSAGGAQLNRAEGAA